MTLVEVPGLETFTIAIVVFFVGSGLNRAVPLFRQWNIPEAVTGGLLAALVTLAAYQFFKLSISFHTDARDLLLLYFFTGIGLNARVSDLLAGGRALAILLAITIGFLVIQNLIAIGAVAALDLPEGIRIFLGSASLIGGHGTTIAWAPVVTAKYGLTNAMEVGIASATLGLVLASLSGGPIARHLITRHGLKSSAPDELMMGQPDPEPHSGADGAGDISHVSILRTLLVLNIVVLIAYALEETVAASGLNIPLFVICLLVGIVLTNLTPRLAPALWWPARTRELSLISSLCLNVFLAMSLMSMQLWALSGLGLALLLVLGLQLLAAVAYILFVVFPLMGRDYEAAVLSAGFTGISLGSTPTAIANMTAVTKLHGPAPRAFIILPLVSAFFIDIANAVAIGLMVR